MSPVPSPSAESSDAPEAPSPSVPDAWTMSPSEDGQDSTAAQGSGADGSGGAGGSGTGPTPPASGAPGTLPASPSAEPLDLDTYPVVPGPGPVTEAAGTPSLGSNNGSGRTPLRDASDSALSGLQNSGRLLEDDAFAALEHAQEEQLQIPQASAEDRATENLRSILAEDVPDESSMAWAEPGPLLARVAQAPAWLLTLLLASAATVGALAYRWVSAYRRRREWRQGG